MLRKAYAERGMVTDGWVSLDPADIGLIEAVYKKTLREGEERLMLAVLESAVETGAGYSYWYLQFFLVSADKPRSSGRKREHGDFHNSEHGDAF